MNDRSNNNRRDARGVAKKPDLLGYAVRPIGDGQKSSWSKVAAAWAHKDGQGFEVRMDAFPVDGRLVLRANSEDDVIEPGADGPS